MPIGIRAEVRDLTGITDTNDVPDSRIDTALEYGRGELYAITLKTDWDTDTNHPLYKKAEMLVQYVAAYWILDRYAGQAEKANLFRDRVREMSVELKTQFDQYSIISESGDQTTSKFSVVASTYKTFPLNPEGEIHKSSVIIPGDA
jgi:hypothetical protein